MTNGRLHSFPVPEWLAAGGAHEALGVPGLVNHPQDEPVQDEPSTRATLGYRGCNKEMTIGKYLSKKPTLLTAVYCTRIVDSSKPTAFYESIS